MKRNNNYRQNHGIPGVIYILENMGLRHGVYKIGCSRRSGSVRAAELNQDANTGTPGSFRCIFEYETFDCGKAEELVFIKLTHYRIGKKGQEFFEVDLEKAKESIKGVCNTLNHPINTQMVNHIENSNSPQKINEQSSEHSDLKNIYETVLTANSTANFNDPRISPPFKSNNRIARNAILALSISAIFLWFINGLDRTNDTPGTIATHINEHVNVNSPKTNQDKLQLNKETYSEPSNAQNSEYIQANKNQINNADFNSTNSPTGQARHTFVGEEDQIKMFEYTTHQQAEKRSEEHKFPDISNFSKDEQSSINAICSNDKYMNGPVAYNKCMSKQVASLEGTARTPDISSFSKDEQSSINAICSNDKYMNGPVAYNKCMSKQVASLEGTARTPDISSFSKDEQSSINAICSNDKYMNGPVAYNKCISKQVGLLLMDKGH